MAWVLLSLFTAGFESAKDVLSKTRLRTAEAVDLSMAWRVLAIPFLLPPLLFTGIPSLGSAFWWALPVSGILNAAATVLYMQALKASDLSLCLPMVALTPVFLLLTSPLLTGETPGLGGTIGVVLVVAGSYRLGTDSRGRGVLAPFRALWQERGARRMLLVAMIWSVSGNIDKIGTQNSSPFFWAAAIHLCIAVLLSPFVRWRQRGILGRAEVWKMLPVGLVGAAGTLCQMTAITLTLVPYVIAIKRLSTVVSALWGHLYFGEPGLRERLPAVLTMVAGAIVVILG